MLLAHNGTKSKKAVKKTATTTTAPVKTVELPNDAELLAKAQAGDAEAQYNVGLFYENGYGVTKNINNALEWYKKAARNGNSLAKSSLKRLGSTW